jgi:hypothetical protein
VRGLVISLRNSTLYTAAVPRGFAEAVAL